MDSLPTVADVAAEWAKGDAHLEMDMVPVPPEENDFGCYVVTITEHDVPFPEVATFHFDNEADAEAVIDFILLGGNSDLPDNLKQLKNYEDTLH